MMIFLQTAEEKLAMVNVSNVLLENKNALTALDARKKYDVIAVTGSIPEYLSVFEQLLKPGGRLFVVVGSKQVAHATKVVRTENNDFVRTSLFETELKSLVGVKEKSNFIF